MLAGERRRSVRAPSHRPVAAVLVAAVLTLTAACTPATPDVPTGRDDQVEVVTWWASGSEKLALDALVGEFRQQHPETRFVDAAIAGGAGTAAKDLLLSRLRNGDAPDTFQVHGGGELGDYVKARQVQGLEQLWTELGLREDLPPRVVELLTVDGVPYAVPSDIHRANVLWTNPEVLRDAGLDPSDGYATLDEWFADLDTLQAQGQTPLALGSTWTQLHLLEQVLLARLGPEAYSGLWDGSTDVGSEPVAAALADFGRLLSYTNTDRDRLDWQDATQRVIDGQAAFTVMGDWALIPFQQSGLTNPDGVLWSPVPGTEGSYAMVLDAFALPVGAPHPDSAREWLTTVASPEAQTALAAVKGAIPPRTDIPEADLLPYQRWARSSFEADRLVLSVTHGTATDSETLDEVMTAVRRFTTGTTGPAGFQDELADAVR